MKKKWIKFKFLLWWCSINISVNWKSFIWKYKALTFIMKNSWVSFFFSLAESTQNREVWKWSIYNLKKSANLVLKINFLEKNCKLNSSQNLAISNQSQNFTCTLDIHKTFHINGSLRCGQNHGQCFLNFKWKFIQRACPKCCIHTFKACCSCITNQTQENNINNHKQQHYNQT